VAPDARRSGTSDQLVNEVIRWATSQGANALHVGVRSSNAVAIRLYERHGFVTTDLPAEPDELVMTRSLG
jgi:ribosomal protein S18 acetylase RimI-like enzyme